MAQGLCIFQGIVLGKTLRISVYSLTYSPVSESRNNTYKKKKREREKFTYDSVKENYSITHCLLSWQEMSQGHSQGLCLPPLQDLVVPVRWVQAAQLVPWLASEDHLDHQTLEIKQNRFRIITKGISEIKGKLFWKRMKQVHLQSYQRRHLIHTFNDYNTKRTSLHMSTHKVWKY